MVRVAFAAVALVLIGCSERQIMAPLVGSPNPVLILGTEEFLLLGASFGATWDEQSGGGCGSPTYQFSQDSTRWVLTSTDTTWVYKSKNDRVGCTIGTENQGGANYAGGTADIVAMPPTPCCSPSAVQIVADQSNSALLSHVMSSATIQVCANPYISSGFRFVQWNIRRDNQTMYQDYNRCFERNANVNEYEYQAIFKICLWDGWSGRCTNDIQCEDPWNNTVSCEGQGQFAFVPMDRRWLVWEPNVLRSLDRALGGGAFVMRKVTSANPTNRTGVRG
jgi:hypothetical protein